MKVGTARVITYSFVGLFSLFAVRMTPPITPKPQSELFADEAQPESQPEAQPTLRVSPLAGVPISPVFVYASNTEKVDTITVSGVIHSNLYAALDHSQAADLPREARAELAGSLADIFEYRVDMSKDLQDGDKFHILVERLQKPNGAILINKILGARLALSGTPLDAILFKGPGSTGEYFDATGKSLRAAFLRAPVAFRRISSVFGRRYHPILGTWRNHKGTDYAAAMGTPVRSVGDGVVIFAGRKGGYGNCIDVRHRNGYVSRYGHLRNFAKGIHTGAHVEIGKTIGYVGMTGLATGPHLHFEILVGGVQRDPRVALKMKGGMPIAASEKGVFDRMKSRTLASFGLPSSSSN